MTYCRLAIDRPPQLPLSRATEDCLAGWQDISYAEYQRGILPEHNPQTATSAGLTTNQQQLIYRAQQNAYNVYRSHDQAAAQRTQAVSPPVAPAPSPQAQTATTDRCDPYVIMRQIMQVAPPNTDPADAWKALELMQTALGCRPR